MLKRRGTYSVSVNGIQHYTRCPFCGDSSNLSHAHLSIKIDTDSDEPMFYHCLKCSVAGIVDETFLEELDIYLTPEIKESLKSYTKKALRFGKLKNTKNERYRVPLYKDTYANQRKLDYLNQRLGTSIGYQEAQNYKIILNLVDFMVYNDIMGNDRDALQLPAWQLQKLNDNYIGFLTTNNNCIVFRDITGTQKYRYYKTPINSRNVNKDSFYSIPLQLELMYTRDINIHIAEGIFDILSVKENLIKDKKDNFFFAVCGFGPLSILKFLIRHGVNTGIHLHIYCDNDKSDREQERYLFNKEFLTEWVDRIYFHRNQVEGEKDYGVPLSRIKDGYRKVK